MSKEAVFTLKLEPELRDAFVNAAEAAHRPASQVVRELMREFVQNQAHNAWFRAEVEHGLRDAADPTTLWISNEDIEADWKIERARLASGR